MLVRTNPKEKRRLGEKGVTGGTFAQKKWGSGATNEYTSEAL